MANAFQRLVAALDYPMHIVTAAAAGERCGCLVGFGSQCSIDPPRYLVGISKANHTAPVAEQATTLAVHLPRENPEERDLATFFGETTGDEVDKFAHVDWTPWTGDGRTPLLDGCPRWFVGRVVARHDVGDHVAYVLEPVDASAEDGEQLGFQDVKDLEAGHPV